MLQDNAGHAWLQLDEHVRGTVRNCQTSVKKLVTYACYVPNCAYEGFKTWTKKTSFTNAFPTAGIEKRKRTRAPGFFYLGVL